VSVSTDEFPEFMGTTGSGTVVSLDGDGAVYCTERAGSKAACRDFALPGEMTCAMHKKYTVSVTPEQIHADTASHVTRKLLRLAPEALDTLEEVMRDPGAPAGIRAKAADSLLDRAGYRGAIDVKVEVEHTINPSDIILERLDRLAPRSVMGPPEDLTVEGEDIEDAVIVEAPAEEPEAQPVDDFPALPDVPTSWGTQ
jgi:hypothetical protein